MKEIEKVIGLYNYKEYHNDIIFSNSIVFKCGGISIRTVRLVEHIRFGFFIDKCSL
jgi:hypothetical protein